MGFNFHIGTTPGEGNEYPLRIRRRIAPLPVQRPEVRRFIAPVVLSAAPTPTNDDRPCIAKFTSPVKVHRLFILKAYNILPLYSVNKEAEMATTRR